MATNSKKQKTETPKTASSAFVTVLKGADVNFKEGVSVSPECFSNWVRALLLNWRQGTVASKGRSDISFSRKKPWKQKGTGRARAGTARSPIWRKGGVIFGPQARVRTLTVPRRAKQAVKHGLLSGFLANERVYCIDWEPKTDAPKTSLAVRALKEAHLHGKKITLFLSFEDALAQASWANLPQVNVVFFDEPNALNLANSDCWIVLKKDMDKFKEMVSQWH